MSPRFLIPLMFGVLMALSAHWLGASDKSALSLGLVPAVLGWIGVLQNISYTATGLVFVCACLHSANPALYDQGVEVSADWVRTALHHTNSVGH